MTPISCNRHQRVKKSLKWIFQLVPIEKKNKILASIKRADESLQQLRSTTAEFLRNPSDPSLCTKIEGLLPEIKKATKGTLQLDPFPYEPQNDKDMQSYGILFI